MKPTLIIVRHGETEGQSSIRYHGRTDVVLSELGRAQMRAAREAIERIPGGLVFERVFTTPLVRASEGARLIAGETAPLAVIEEFIEVHFGLFEGLTAEEIRTRYPEEYAPWNADRLAADFTYPQGESRAAFASRVERGVDKMLAIWPPGAGGRALVVAHRGVIRAIVNRLAGHNPVVELGSIQILGFDRTWHPLALDVTGHLAAV
jgi:broad specificity phosphatase PhoE